MKRLILLSLVFMMAAAPAHAQEIYLPVVARPCTSFVVREVHPCTHHYCQGNSYAFLFPEPFTHELIFVTGTRVLFDGEEVPSHFYPYEWIPERESDWAFFDKLGYGWVFFDALDFASGTEVSLTVYFENGCEYTAISEYGYISP